MRDLRGKLGMHEMEVAACIILDKIEKEGRKATFTYGDFYEYDQKDKNNHSEWAMKGYCELLYRGWLDRAMYNGQFTASMGLLERLIENPQNIPEYIPMKANYDTDSTTD